MDKDKFFSIRISAKQKELLSKQAKNNGVTSSELVRTHIIKLIEYGTGLQNNNSDSKA